MIIQRLFRLSIQISILLFIWNKGVAQPRATGLLFEDEVYAQLPRLPLFDPGAKAEIKALKGIHKVDLKPFCPYPGHQGNIGSCVGWAVGYGAYSTLLALQNSWKGQRTLITKQAMSALYIYNQIKVSDCKTGAHISDAMNLLHQEGDILSSQFDADKENCHRLPTEDQRQQALLRKIKDFQVLFRSNDSEEIKVVETKLSLKQRKPVVVGMAIRTNFTQIRPGESFWWPDIGNTTPHGGHAMVVIGFDDDKGAFEIMNSWGRYWGNDGYIWVKYKDFSRFCKYAYQFSLENNSNTKSSIQADLQFRFPVARVNDSIQFETPPVWLDGDILRINKVWTTGDLFQIILDKISPDTYFYLISLDPAGKLNVHWPRNSKLDQQYREVHETAYIPISNINLALPSSSSAFRLEREGTEYFIALQSSSPIKDLKYKLIEIKKLKHPTFERLQEIFDNKLVKLKHILNPKEKITISQNCFRDQIVPLIIQLQVSK